MPTFASLIQNPGLVNDMHILLIHQLFVTGGEAGGTRHFELGQHLERNGHRVTVIAGQVSYLTGEVLVGDKKNTTGIDIRRTWTYAAFHRSFFARFMSFMSFMVSSLVTALRVHKVDIIWGTSPPIFQAATAYAVARLKRVPFILEIRDLWPDFAIETGVLNNKALIWASRRLERFLYNRADRLVVNSPGFIPHISGCGVAPAKIELVPNGVDITAFKPADKGEDIRRQLGCEGKFVVLYAGAHGLANDLETLLVAARYLAAYPQIIFLLVGGGKERDQLRAKAEEMELDDVNFVPAQPKERIPDYLAAADVCIAILKNIPMFATTYPNKVFDYMAAARPTVLAIDGVIRQVVEDAEGGTFVEPGNPRALADVILTYYKDRELCRIHGLQARRHVAAKFDRELQGAKLRIILEGLKS